MLPMMSAMKKGIIKTTRFNVMTRYENKKDRQGITTRVIGYIYHYDLNSPSILTVSIAR